MVAGQTTESFKRYLYPGAVHRSFSLLYKDSKPDNATRTLDLTASSEQDFELWFCGLQVLPRSCEFCYVKRISGSILQAHIILHKDDEGWCGPVLVICCTIPHTVQALVDYIRPAPEATFSKGRMPLSRPQLSSPLAGAVGMPFGGPESGASLKSPPISVPKMLQITDGTSKLSPPGLGGGTAQVIPTQCPIGKTALVTPLPCTHSFQLCIQARCVQPSSINFHSHFPQSSGVGSSLSAHPQGRVTGAMGVPVPEHQPGDCYMWGASRPVQPAYGSKLQVQSSVPQPIKDTTHLDVMEVGCLLHLRVWKNAATTFTVPSRAGPLQ